MATKAKEIIEIAPIETIEAQIRIVGDSPLITHAWSAKAKREILEKELGYTKTKAREPKNPIEDFVSSMYWLTPMPEEFTAEAVGKAFAEGAKFGFSVGAFKQAALSASYRMGWSKDKASMRGVFFIKENQNGYYGGDLKIDWDKKRIIVLPNQFKLEPMIEIHSDTPVMREDMVRVGNGAADIRYRGEFNNWSADITIRFNKNGLYSLDQIVNIINAGGFACGVGEWRAEKDGQYGLYHVETANE